MNFIRHYKGIHGGYLEFQISNIKDPERFDHWHKDSLYAGDVEDVAHKIFEKFLGDGWFYDFNQLDYRTTVEFMNSLADAGVVKELTTWTLKRIREDKYLNILGV